MFLISVGNSFYNTRAAKLSLFTRTVVLDFSTIGELIFVGKDLYLKKKPEKIEHLCITKMLEKV